MLTIFLSRYFRYVSNETATHYTAVNNVIDKSWISEKDPALLYTNAGLLMVSSSAWLDVNTANIADNTKLLPSLDETNSGLLVVGPPQMMGVHQHRTRFLGKQIVLNSSKLLRYSNTCFQSARTFKQHVFLRTCVFK